MKKYIMPRATGKTTQLIIESHKSRATIVALNTQYAKDLAERMHCDIPEPITFREFLLSPKAHDKTYLIDELDCCLRTLNVVGYSNDMQNELE